MSKKTTESPLISFKFKNKLFAFLVIISKKPYTSSFDFKTN